jgi:hypothetical protein
VSTVRCGRVDQGTGGVAQTGKHEHVPRSVQLSSRPFEHLVCDLARTGVVQPRVEHETLNHSGVKARGLEPVPRIPMQSQRMSGRVEGLDSCECHGRSLLPGVASVIRRKGSIGFQHVLNVAAITSSGTGRSRRLHRVGTCAERGCGLSGRS